MAATLAGVALTASSRTTGLTSSSGRFGHAATLNPDIAGAPASGQPQVDSVRSVAWVLLAILSASWQTAMAQQAAPRLLHEVFQDHAVLQRDRVNHIWGAAGSGELITIMLRRTASTSGAAAAIADAAAPAVAAVTARADATGSWSTELPALQAGGPYVLTARSSSGITQQIKDVLSGDVFLCSGQSNMEMQVLRASNSYDEIRNSANDSIRLLGIRQADSARPLARFRDPVAWQVAGPQTVPDWSAVCFFFARELQTFTHVPIGLIQASWGGSNIRPWISAAGLHGLGSYEPGLRLLSEYAGNPAAAQSQFAAAWEQWWRTGSGDRPGTEPWRPRNASQWRTAPPSLGDWRGWGIPELKNFTGSVWHRTRITLTAAQAKSAATGRSNLTLGSINQVDETWLNGQAIGNTFGYEADRAYEIPKGLLHAGENVLVTNIMTTYGPGGLLAKGAKRALHLPNGDSIPLEGPWEYSIVPDSMGYPPRAPWEPVGGLSTLYNAMIAPLGSYGLRGVLWYQGESNTSEAGTYRSLLEALMADWRRRFAPDLPFLIVQLPNYGPLPTKPGESGWAEVREAERLAVANDAHAGLAVTIDVGDAHNLHPTNKQDVAKRLAIAARHVIFGEPGPPSGPRPLAATRGPNGIEVEFADVTGDLLTYSHATPIGFELCGDSPGSCRFSSARIEGSRVLLPIPDGPVPTRVRYCWADSPVCTLADHSSLPSTPFELRVQPSALQQSTQQDGGRTLGVQDGGKTLGVFEGQTDVGTVVPAGTASFNSRAATYTLTAAGANTWYHVDNFHYLWKRAAGDFALTADVVFPPVSYGHQPDPHRKGILMFRQTLDAGAKYVGAAYHGSGLMALQFRREQGANAEDVEINGSAPRTVRIEKRGDVFTLFESMQGEPLHQTGASVTLHLEEPFYIGLGVVSHDVNTTDKVEFSHVTLEAPVPQSGERALYSTLQTISINDQFRRAMVIRSVPGYLQSANWAPDGKRIYLYEAGRIQSVPYLDPPAGGPPHDIDTGKLVDCSGNFGLSPDGKLLAVSCAEAKGGQRDVYVIPDGGATGVAGAGASGQGIPRKVTSGTVSSYFHAWAPDSRAIAFTRGRAARADIFTVALNGGPERQLTSDTVNDAPDYSPDGKWIYFDSSRSGTTQLWRMKPDGSAAEQITADEYLNSSPHVSPDGKTVAFLSQVVASPVQEPAPDGSDILPTALRVIDSADGLIRTVARFEGSRGSLSMYGWGDATHLAFVSYRMLPAAGARHEVSTRPAITGVSHIAVYTTDPNKTEGFYVHDLGALKGSDPENARGTRYYFAPTQFVEVVPVPAGPPSINRLDHVAFTTSDAELLRKYLSARKIAVPGKLEQGNEGSRWFDVTDPEGNRIEFVEPPAQPMQMALNPLSHHLIHVGFIVHDRAREDTFYRGVLGFRPYWFGGMTDEKPTWISQQVPDGTDWLEYMLVGAPDERGIPATMTQANLGVLNHFSLGVQDTRHAYTLLWKEDRLSGQSNTPKIGRDAKWQLNLLDPDGTRAEIMELHAIGPPCCSPFTAADPQQ